MQHAYDTRLKRDVAIKCIKITQKDITRASRAQISIHDAQAINASRPLSDLMRASSKESAALPWEDAADAASGFIPLTAKISDPSFLDKNEERRANRARRHSLLRQRRAEANSVAVDARQREWTADSPTLSEMDLSDFDQYSNFKGAGRGKRREPIRTNSDSFTLGLMEFGDIPGKIKGAGEVDITSINDVVGVAVESDGGERDAAIRKSAQVSISGKASKSDSDSRALAPADDDEQPFVDLNKLDHIPGLEEARTAAHLNDANIVTVYDCVVEGDTAYVIMEYVEGKTLAKILREIGNDITLDMIAAVFTSVSHALEVAHKAGVLHLDVKPENVIVNNDGVVKVTDFGLSALMDASGQGSTGGGTIGYMPLEQMRQQRLDVRTDEWALASLTYEMLSGTNPFKARDLREAEAAIEGAELVIPSLCWDQIDDSVDDIMFDALSPNADGRYSDIASFSEELTPLLGSSKDGSKQLAEVVKGDASLMGLPGGSTSQSTSRSSKPAVPHTPFIDKLGMRGSSIIMRIASVLGTAMLAVISLMNFRFTFGRDAQATTQLGDYGTNQAFQSGADTTFGLFSIAPLAAWVIIAVLAVLAFVRPRWVFPVNVCVLFVMLVFNQAWLPAIMMIVASGAWWWFFGRTSDMMCTLVLLQPLFGSVGFAAVVPVLAGALLDVRDALVTAAMVALWALVFAALGSADVMSWDIFSNFIVAVNPAISGASISNSFMETLASLQNWCVVASWIAAAVVYALLCRRGTRTFDVIAAVAAAALIVAGILVVPLATGNLEMLNPLTISGAAIAALLGVVLALIAVPDRVRLAPGEW